MCVCGLGISPCGERSKLGALEVKANLGQINSFTRRRHHSPTAATLRASQIRTDNYMLWRRKTNTALPQNPSCLSMQETQRGNLTGCPRGTATSCHIPQIWQSPPYLSLICVKMMYLLNVYPDKWILYLHYCINIFGGLRKNDMHI